MAAFEDAVRAAAARPASDARDVVSKINLWRLLAPEDMFDASTQTLDEILLMSIIDDTTAIVTGRGDD